MNDKHITEVLDNAALAALSPSELDEIRAHVRDCEPCAEAFAAAQLSALVIKQRAQAMIEPSPFFQTRVMAAIREQQAVESVPAFSRLWKSARGLVSSMALTTAALAALSFVVAAPATSSPDQTTAALSAESVIFGQDADDLTYEQVMNAIYEDDEDR
ncbi:MAG TPA: hypothetical protein VJS13_11425 [Pyrinomonadaceae bacterium]|nr:hypothetical protein [Pyrinomonadaceae bacterium]